MPFQYPVAHEHYPCGNKLYGRILVAAIMVGYGHYVQQLQDGGHSTSNAFDEFINTLGAKAGLIAE